MSKLDAKEKLRAKVAMLNGDEDVLEFTHKGRICVIRNAPSFRHYNAYVQTRLRCVYNTKRHVSPEREIRCHGGVTFGGTLPGRKGWFFGMDFAHYGDFIEMPQGMKINMFEDGHKWTNMFEDGHKWTIEEVKIETEELCEEVLRYEMMVKGKHWREGGKNGR
jgi:hypothetical protein